LLSNLGISRLLSLSLLPIIVILFNFFFFYIKLNKFIIKNGLKDKAAKHVLNINNINTCADITVDIRRCDADICSSLIENTLEFAIFHRNAVGALQGRSDNILVISPTATAAAGCRNVSYDLLSVVFRVRSNSSSSIIER